MRGSHRRVVVLSLACFVACSRAESLAATNDGVLQLELGGSHGSLRQALLAANIHVEPPRRLQPEVEPAAPPEAEPAAAPAPVVEPVPPTPEPDPEPDWFLVNLGPKQTLIHLAKKHLGDGNRYRELMTLNGWSEDDLRRLPAGQPVKIPRVRGDRPR